MIFKIIKLKNCKNFFPFRKPKFPFGKKIVSIKMTNDSFISEFFFFFSEIIWTFTIVNNFSNYKILIFEMVELNLSC